MHQIAPVKKSFSGGGGMPPKPPSANLQIWEKKFWHPPPPPPRLPNPGYTPTLIYEIIDLTSVSNKSIIY